ncbi:DUF4258 domain-containing protein [bacterium]|nr:DUF4258 domain-containing protein [bacterium]
MKVNIVLWKTIFASERVIWKRHALQRMVERGITQSMVLETIESGHCIEDYEDDYPFPSALFARNFNSVTIHVVAAVDNVDKWGFIITVYKPDWQHFQPGFMKRKTEGE